MFEIFTIAPACIVYLFTPQFSLNYNQLFVYVGLFIFIIGILFSVWAKIVMGKNWNQPVEHVIERQSEIVKDGPFKYSRNPIYVGIVVFVTGFFITLKSPFIITLLILSKILNNIISKEEENLEKLFEEKYMEYKKQVPRYLLF